MTAALSPRQRYGYLPAILWHVLEAAGEDAMLRLVAMWGGIRIWLVREPDTGHKLTEAVGLEAALRIHARLVAEHIKQIDVPRMSQRLEMARRQRILAMRADGTKVCDIARALAMTERGVYKALARARTDGGQLSLF